jgi:hypothetical protein
MARREPIRLGPEACADPPAVHAWRSLGGREPRALVVLKEEQWSERRSLAYRLEGAAPEGSVVTKRCPREAAELARLANATFWRALDGLAGHVAWGFEKLEACDADFSALAPVLLEESPSRAAPSLEGRP